MIRLSEHKNTLEKRKRKELRKEIEGAARELARNSHVSEKVNGYGLVVWDDDGNASAHWKGGRVPSMLIGEYFKQTIARTINIADTEALLKGDL